MYSTILTAQLCGIRTIPVRAEVDVSNGIPVFDMVGSLSSEVREARERVRTALRNCGIFLPAKRITVNLSPANIRKTGTGFDLPIAAALLVSLGLLERSCCEGKLFIGELSLNGRLLPVKGILPVVSDGKEQGIHTFLVPKGNEQEAALVKGVRIYAFSALSELIACLNGTQSPPEPKNYSYNNIEETVSDRRQPDFSEVNGQRYLKRACEVAAAGMHNMLMVGPPGAGKTMISERMATILPPLTEEERLEISKIYSVCGRLSNTKTGILARPFRSPHHTVTKAGLLGGGRFPMPGEISLAHGGVLFLDELTEFDKPVLEGLRQPLEEHQIRLTRADGSVDYPAGFLLMAAMNPCNCGNYPDRQKCLCSDGSIRRHYEKLSRPLLDRMDLCVEAMPLSYEDLTRSQKNESSAAIRERVARCHEIQRRRYQNEPFFHNSRIPGSKIGQYCALGEKEEAYMRSVYEKAGMTARTYHKLLRVARTIADLEEEEQIRLRHLAEAVCYRSAAADGREER